MKISRMVGIVILILVLALSSFAVSPIIWIDEVGNVTNPNSDIVTGNLTLQSGFQYNSFIALIGNFSYFNFSIKPTDSLFLEWNRTFDKPGLDEGFQFYRNRSELKLSYNISNEFDGDANYLMNVTLPSGCINFNYQINDTINNGSIVGTQALFDYNISLGESLLLNLSCTLTIGSGNVTVPGATYDILAEHVVKDYDINILPKSYLSVEKDPLDRRLNQIFDPDDQWRIGFNFFNEDPISIKVTDVHLWAIPIPYVTDDPSENMIHDVHLDTCLNHVDGILDQDDVCVQETIFTSSIVPAVWSELTYETLWDYRVNGDYFYQGENFSFDLDAPFVTLVAPPNASYQDVEANISLEYEVNLTSECTLYTNITGVWISNSTQYNVTNSSFNFISPLLAQDFRWNVFCVANDLSNTGFAKNNWTILLNGLPRQIQNITNITWAEDTSRSIDMDDYFVDPESDDMNYTIHPASILNISVLVDNNSGNITFIPDPNFHGVRLAQVGVHDQYNRTVFSDVFVLNVTNVPDAPKIIFWNITNGTWWTTNETFINVTEGETLTFEADATDIDFLAGESVPDTWFYWLLDGILQSIGRIWSWSIDVFQQGLRNVTLVVNDSDNLSDSRTWLVNVSNYNIPPTSITIPDFEWIENATLVVNLSNYFQDIDAIDEFLNYTFAGNLDNLSITIDNSTSLMYIVPDIGFHSVRERWMIITANDTESQTNASNLFYLTIYPWIIKSFENITFYEDEYNDSINLHNQFNTLNYTYGNLSWGTNGSSNLNIFLGSNGVLNFSAISNWNGNESVKLVAYNYNSWNDSSVFGIEVIPVNDPPVINETRFILNDSTGPNIVIDVWDYSYDVDHTYLELDYSILSQTNPALVGCSLISNRYLNCTAPSMLDHGRNKVNISVFDGENNVSSIFHIVLYHDNTPPTKVNLTHPLNDTFWNSPFTFNWTESFDPDEGDLFGSDYWDFVYIIQVDNDPYFTSPEIDIQFKNATSYDLDILLNDDLFYWRVITFDGLDASVSDTFQFVYDANIPTYDFDISPNPAEYGLRDVDIDWTVYDTFIDETYVNVSYPNGTFLGQYFQNFTLTPTELTRIGDYAVTLFILDAGNHTVFVYDTLRILNDTDAPVITLINPSDNSVIRQTTTLFSYEYEDYNNLKNCTLFMQKMNIIYDVVGGIIYAQEAGPWESVSVDTTIESGVNYFIRANLEEDSYGWNVGCYDLAGNYGESEINYTFRVILRDEEAPLDIYPLPDEQIPIAVISEGGYNIRAEIYPVRSETGELVSGILEVRNIGGRAIYDLSFWPSFEWIYFKNSIPYIASGESVNISFDIYSPYYPGDYLYHIVLFTDEFKLLVPGSLKVTEPVNMPFKIVKRVSVNDDYYNITLSLSNYLKRPIQFYLEDPISTMSDIIYNPLEFNIKPLDPPYLIMQQFILDPKESINVSYTSRKFDIETAVVPTILTNEVYDVSLEIVYPHGFDVRVFRNTPVELLLIISFVIFFFILMIYFFIQYLRRQII